MTGSRRTAILDAATATIATEGVRGLRVEEVAKRAEVAVSLIYYHFTNRAGLLQATLEHANERARSTDAHTEGTGAERVGSLLAAEFDAERRGVSVVWGEILAQAVFAPELRDQLVAAASTWTGIVAERIVAGQGDGSIPANLDPPSTAERLTALVDGLSSRWLAGVLDRERALELLSHGLLTEFSV